MHKSPLVLGINSNTFDKYSTSIALEIVGGNTGNIIFSEALFRCIGGGVRSSYDFTPADLEGRDAIVVTAANWVNSDSEFTELLRNLEKTNLPIYTIGLGAQADSKDLRPNLKPDQDRLIRFLADRCVTLSVRGAYSAEVLSDLGIKNVDVTGCPSLLLMGEEVHIKRSDGPSKVTLHGTRHGFSGGLPEQDLIYQIAFKNKYDLVLQSELADMTILNNNANEQDEINRACLALQIVYKGKSPEEIKYFTMQHAKSFFILSEWIKYARSRDFFIGTRIHGTIAALLGGARALLLTHDARTSELAEALNIPHMPISDIQGNDDIELNHLFDISSPDKLKTGYRKYRNTFKQFMKRNSLSISNPDPLY